jgi:uncharacterized protein
MNLALIPIFLLLGAAIGFMAGLLGIGGGFTTVPVLTEVFAREGIAARHVLPMAIGTSAAIIIFTTISSARAHHARGAVLWPIVRTMSPGLVVGSLIGAQIASALPMWIMAGIFGAFTWFAAFRMLFVKPPKVTRTLPAAAGMFGVGTGIGVAAGMVGTGGAFIAVPFMARCGVTPHAAVATSAALAFPVACAATLGFVLAGLRQSGLPPYSLGYVYVPALVAITVCSVFVAPLGARVAHAWSGVRLRKAFAMMLLVLGGFMWWKALSAI